MATRALRRRIERQIQETVASSPAPIPWRERDEAQEAADGYCPTGECVEVRVDGPHGWACFVVCGLPGRGRCAHDHAHHDDEPLWLAGTG